MRRVENVVGKGKNAGFQHFLFFPLYFQTLSFSGSLKVQVAVKKKTWEKEKILFMSALPLRCR